MRQCLNSPMSSALASVLKWSWNPVGDNHHLVREEVAPGTRDTVLIFGHKTVETTKILFGSKADSFLELVLELQFFEEHGPRADLNNADLMCRRHNSGKGNRQKKQLESATAPRLVLRMAGILK